VEVSEMDIRAILDVMFKCGIGYSEICFQDENGDIVDVTCVCKLGDGNIEQVASAAYSCGYVISSIDQNIMKNSLLKINYRFIRLVQIEM